MLDRFGTDPRFRVILFTVDETAYSRELAPIAGTYPSVRLGAPWWFLDSPEGMRRFREAATETAGFYNTSGFVDDTRAFASIPARHDLFRRVDAGYLARLVLEHRLGLDEAIETAVDLAYNLPLESYAAVPRTCNPRLPCRRHLPAAAGRSGPSSLSTLQRSERLGGRGERRDMRDQSVRRNRPERQQLDRALEVAPLMDPGADHPQLTHEDPVQVEGPGAWVDAHDDDRAADPDQVGGHERSGGRPGDLEHHIRPRAAGPVRHPWRKIDGRGIQDGEAESLDVRPASRVDLARPPRRRPRAGRPRR